MTFRTLTGRPPRRALPDGAIDCHIHVFDSTRFTSQPGGPGCPADATVSDYEHVQEWLGMNRVVVIQGNGYQFDNSCTLDALRHFGAAARAVVAIRPDIEAAELDRLTALGVRGARIMNLLQGAAGLDMLAAVNARIHPFGWSMIVQFDGRDILSHRSLLESIRGDYVIDHTGKFLEPVAVDSPEFRALLKLVDRGNCYVKLAGCYETSCIGYPGYDDVAALAKALIAHAPDRIIWGSNWPHNMAQSRETYPDDVHLLDLVSDWAGTDENRRKIFIDNPSRLYGF